MTGKKRLLIPVAVVVVAIVIWRFVVPRDASAADLAASGTVEATEAQLGFASAGRITRIAPREGDAVRAGDELAALDDDEMVARRRQAVAVAAAARAVLRELERGSRIEEVAQAQAAADAAAERVNDVGRDRDRTRTLFEGGAASREQLDKASSSFEVARSQQRQAEEQLRMVKTGPRRERIEAQRAQLAQAEAAVAAIDAQLANMTVRATIDGVVSVRHREEGETVQPGSPVLTVMNPSDRWVRIYVPENRLAAVKIGMPATITTDTYEGKQYAGQVSFIAREAEFTPKTVQTSEERVKLVYAVKVRIEGDVENDLKPGMPADVELLPETPE